jgi:hypothetical protein
VEEQADTPLPVLVDDIPVLDYHTMKDDTPGESKCHPDDTEHWIRHHRVLPANPSGESRLDMVGRRYMVARDCMYVKVHKCLHDQDWGCIPSLFQLLSERLPFGTGSPKERRQHTTRLSCLTFTLRSTVSMTECMRREERAQDGSCD